jgi:hypothetical protein
MVASSAARSANAAAWTSDAKHMKIKVLIEFTYFFPIKITRITAQSYDIDPSIQFASLPEIQPRG